MASTDMSDNNKDAIRELADQIKAGDDSLNKLKVQNLDFILDIPLKVSVELGRAKVIIKDLLQLGQGSVLELDKLAGEPLEVLVNGKLVARGEVVVVNEKFAPVSQEVYFIVPDKCTECTGFHEEPQCAAVCPVDCCVPDPDHEESVEVLLDRKERLHL